MSKSFPNSRYCAAKVHRTVSQLCRKLRPDLKRDGISMAKLSVIGQIYRAGRITPGEVAAREGVKIQTLTRTLAELESQGWLLREPHKTDGRQSVLTLTSAGKARLAGAAKASDTLLSEVIEATFTPEERLQLASACDLLERLDLALSQKTKRVPREADTLQ
jgi:DNA-binding MarR family transcriptional regulator